MTTNITKDKRPNLNRTSFKTVESSNRLSFPELLSSGSVGANKSTNNLDNLSKLNLTKKQSSSSQSNSSGRLRLRKAIIIMTGPVGCLLVSLLAILISYLSLQLPISSCLSLATLLVTIRFGFHLFHPSRPVLKQPVVHRKNSHTISDELIISLLLIAASWIIQLDPSRSVMLLFVGVNQFLQIVALQVSHFALKKINRNFLHDQSSQFNKAAIIVGTGKKAKEVADLILDSPEMETMLIGFMDYSPDRLWRYRDIPLIGHPDLFEEIAATCHLDSLVMAVEPKDMPGTCDLFEIAEKMGIPVCFMPDIYSPKIAKAYTANLNGYPAIIYRAVPENKVALFIKKIMDRIGALAGLLLVSPIMIATAIAIKVDSRGPIFFCQKRSGLNGKIFDLFKFRTMGQNAEKEKKSLTGKNEMSGPVFKIKDDPRVTRVGHFIRKYSLDELPQFFNVLLGEMSLVGPRPPLPVEVAQYKPWQHRKLSVKPGVTCLWQVGGRNNIDFDDWMRLDLEYIDNWSLWLDAKLLAKTIPAVMKGDGAS